MWAWHNHERRGSYSPNKCHIWLAFRKKTLKAERSCLLVHVRPPVQHNCLPSHIWVSIWYEWRNCFAKSPNSWHNLDGAYLLISEEYFAEHVWRNRYTNRYHYRKACASYESERRFRCHWGVEFKRILSFGLNDIKAVPFAEAGSWIVKPDRNEQQHNQIWFLLLEIQVSAWQFNTI